MKTMEKVTLKDTSILYDDGSKTERYTDTGDYKTAKYKAVLYEFCSERNMYVKRYFFLYKRCPSGMFGNHVTYQPNRKGKQYSTLKQCEKEITAIESK